MNAPIDLTRRGIVYHDKFDQGSIEWFKARCGLLTASEMKNILSVSGGGIGKTYKLTGNLPDKITPARQKAIDAIAGRDGSVSELCTIADVSDGVIRALIKDDILAAEEKIIPLSFKSSNDDKARSHVWELLAQRITGYVDETYESWDILRGREDEIEMRHLYSQHFEPVDECGFITNDEWGFTLGYSPDGLIGDDGLLEGKSRKQKFQAQTIVEYSSKNEIPPEFMAQAQTGLLVTKRKWLDFASYSGGMPMIVTRVPPIPEWQDAILSAARDFEAKIADARVIYDAMMASGARLIPTKRLMQPTGDLK
jgi:YqaJ-like viral recombinase domain